MRVEFLKAQKSDFDDVVDFVNYVFSHSGDSVDFPSLLPKLYKTEYNTMGNHYIVKENNKIKGVVGSFPIELDVDGERLKIAGIGSVSVHPYSRGSGYMKKLMGMALKDMTKDGIHISCLGGKKQRYEYFGYIPCGQKLYFTINNENIRHKLKASIKENIIFREIRENDKETLNMVYNIYCTKNYKFIREKSQFLDILKSWKFKVYSIMEDNIFIGYLVASEDKKYISELVVRSEEYYLTAMANYINFYNIDEVNIELPIWEKNKISNLYEVAEESTINNCYQFNIINYEEVLEKLLKFKSSYSKIDDGKLIVEIEEYGIIEIVAINGEVSVKRCHNRVCEVKLNHLKAMELFFSPFSCYIVGNENINKILKSWFPIPLFIPTQDKV